MNILLITIFFVGFMVSEIPRVSVFGHCPYYVTFPMCDIRNTGYAVRTLLPATLTY